ncbi:MAG: hypothetical protein JXA54_14310 [Candidatus Heimdallarchaeota archaeon]|nr:hypothetical protein [Candidatus Heimdallarchaeota archaeon]
MVQLKLPRKWLIAIVGVADWLEKVRSIPHQEFIDLQKVIDDFLSKTYRAFRKRGALVGSLLWSQENLAPMFLLEATKMNENFLKEQRAIINNITEKIHSSLSSEERHSPLGKNLQEISLEGRILILEGIIPDGEFYPDEQQIAKVFSDAFNAEFITIKRAEHDFEGRKNWLSALDSVVSREFTIDIGPIKKLKEAKEIEGKRFYDKKIPGDFEKIVRILSEAIPYRASLFEVEKPSNSSFDTREPLGHIIIQYLSTEGDFPIKIDNRSTTHDRIGRKLENYQWVIENSIDWKVLDKLYLNSKEIMYEKIEKTITDVGGIKLDGFWTEREISSNVFFLSKFTFTEDILKQLRDFLNNTRKYLETQIGPGTTELYEIWQKAGLHFNILIFEIKGLDQDEDKKLSYWFRSLKERQIPGPNYSAEKEVIEARHYRPL